MGTRVRVRVQVALPVPVPAGYGPGKNFAVPASLYSQVINNTKIGGMKLKSVHAALCLLSSSVPFTTVLTSKVSAAKERWKQRKLSDYRGELLALINLALIYGY